MSRGQPTATGVLSQTPMSQLIVYAMDKRLTGTFVLQGAGGDRSALLVENGVPVKAKTSVPVVHLGRVLLELGSIDEAAYNRTLNLVASERRLHGEILLQAGFIDHEMLEAALGEQLVQQVVWMFSLPEDTAYGFYSDQNYLERWAADGAVIEPLAALWRGIRGYERMDRVEAAVARLGAHPLKLHPRAQVARFRFAPSDQPILDVLRARRMSLADLENSGAGDPSVVRRAMYTLMITRHLEVGGKPIGIDTAIGGDARMTAQRALDRMDRITEAVRGGSSVPVAARPVSAALRSPPPFSPMASAPPSSPMASAPPSSPMASSPPSSPSASPPARISGPPEAPISRPPVGPSLASALQAARAVASSPSHPAPPPPNRDSVRVSEFRSDLEGRLSALPSQNYYEIIGVPQNAPGPAISAAFFQLAKRFHPDRLGPELESVRPDAVKLFSRMTEAHQILTDEQQRGEYDQVLKEGGGTAGEQEEVQKVMRAVLAHQKALVLLRKQNFAEAEQLARQAMELDPSQQEYVGLLVSTLCRAPGTPTKQLRELESMIDDAVDNDPENDKVRFARGELFKKLGRLDDAVRDFKWVADHDPRNVDAAREVRLYIARNPDKPLPGRRSLPPPRDRGLLGKFFKR